MSTIAFYLRHVVEVMAVPSAQFQYKAIEWKIATKL
jgi:hypothetical protein